MTKHYTKDELDAIWRGLKAHGYTLERQLEVGDLWVTTRSGNPAALLGYGTWTAFGAGRVLVGIKASDADFNVMEETGGSKTLEIADHDHHTHDTTATATISTGDVQSGTGATVVDGIVGTPATSTDETPTLDHVQEGTGLSEMPIMPPYIVVAIWKRTA